MAEFLLLLAEHGRGELRRVGVGVEIGTTGAVDLLLDNSQSFASSKRALPNNCFKLPSNLTTFDLSSDRRPDTNWLARTV